METKYCSDPNCTQVNPQPLSSFYSQNKTSKTKGEYVYYNPECKECTKRRSTKRMKQPEVYEQFKEWRRGYWKTDRFKKWSRKNFEEMKDYNKKWRQSNPDKIKEYNQYRQLHKEHEISDNEWEECKKYFNHRCAYCGLKIEEHYITFRGKIQLGDLHREHVDHNGENDLSNCIPACKSCNTSKHTSSLEEWYNISKDFYSKEREDKIYKWIEEDFRKYI